MSYVTKMLHAMTGPDHGLRWNVKTGELVTSATSSTGNETR